MYILWMDGHRKKSCSHEVQDLDGTCGGSLGYMGMDKAVVKV